MRKPFCYVFSNIVIRAFGGKTLCNFKIWAFHYRCLILLQDNYFPNKIYDDIRYILTSIISRDYHFQCALNRVY